MATVDLPSAARRRYRAASGSRKSYSGMLLDAGIMGGLALFGALGAGAVVPVPEGLRLALYTAIMAAGQAFFLQLALERGLKRA